MANKKSGILDLQSIAAQSAALLKKGKKAKFEESDDEADMSEEDMCKGSKEEKKFGKKELKHCLSMTEDEEKKKELSKYLSTFLSDEEDDEDEEEEEKSKKDEKEKGKFSKEVKSLNAECAELKKQNADILEKIALLSKDNQESIACFNEIKGLLNTSK